MTDTHVPDSDIPGHHADSPTRIPFRGWWQVVRRAGKSIGDDHVTLVSAGIAFYFFLAVFPALAAVVSIYGLFFDPAQVQEQMSQMTGFLPPQAHELIAQTLDALVRKPDDSLGISALVSIFISLWSTKKGIAAIFEGTNIAYNEKDERGFFKKQFLTLGFTFGAVLLFLLCLAVVVVLPVLIDNLGLPSPLAWTITILKWPLLAAIIYYAFGLVYKVAPHRHDAELKWVGPGSAVAMVIWIAGSLLFSLYVENFGSYDETYGSFAAVVILMLWFFLTAFTIILGAEINAEAEYQTRQDSTTGADQPPGERGAYHADHSVAGESGSSQY